MCQYCKDSDVRRVHFTFFLQWYSKTIWSAERYVIRFLNLNDYGDIGNDSIDSEKESVEQH